MSFLSVELGSHRIKVVLLERTGGGLSFLKTASQNVPDAENSAALRIKFLKDFVVTHKIRARKVCLAISDPTVITTKNTILPAMPHAELAAAILWHAKEEGTANADNELFSYGVAKELVDEDTAKRYAVNYSVVNTKQLDRYLTLLIRSGFEVTQATTVPLDYTRVLAAQGDGAVSKAVLDVGNGHTALSIYRQDKMIFIRNLSFGLAKARIALNDPLFLGTQYKTPQAGLEIEKAFSAFGIPVGGIAVPEEAGKEHQYWELMRPLLEGLVRELRYSLTYYMTNLKEEKPGSIFLAGHGLEIKGFDAYLAREIGMSGFNLLLPAKVQNKTGEGASRDPAVLGQYVGAIAGVFSGGEAVNFMPLKFRNLRFEKFQRQFLMLTTIAVIGFMMMSFVFTKMRTAYFENRLKQAHVQLQALGKIAKISSEFYPRFRLDHEIDRTSIPAEGVLRLLGHLLPAEIVLQNFALDAEARQMSLLVLVEAPATQRDSAIQEFVKRLKETSFFSKVTAAPDTVSSGALMKIEGEFRND